MKIVLSGGTGRITEKKSRFIADVHPVSSAEEAYAILADTKKKYWDARHSCHAFVIGPANETSHSSDDGEPQGTAGKPILQVLTSSGVRNCLVIVTRYFGGVLLGTGGLVRAYSEAARAGLDCSEIGEELTGTLLRIRCSYDLLGKVQYLIASSSLYTTDTAYTDVCETEVLVPDSRLPSFTSSVTEKTAGKAEYVKEQKVSYVKTSDGQIREIRPF